MEIFRINDALEESLINGQITITDLPDNNLKKMVLKALKDLQRAKKITVTFNKQMIVQVFVDLPTKITTLSLIKGLTDEKKRKIIETLYLLNWHLSPRWIFSNPDIYGSPRHCADCGRTATPQSARCQNHSCVSQENYRLVSGE